MQAQLKSHKIIQIIAFLYTDIINNKPGQKLMTHYQYMVDNTLKIRIKAKYRTL